jgi:hypothetical protein|tara:strand:- start:50 stop:502 length:453 start_codon:yes stop_codon:yes gene_type:complete
MVKYFLYISLSLLTFNLSLAKNIDIQEDIKIDYVCKFEKKILKNLEHNYKTFLAKDLNEENLNKLEINAKQPEMLLINGLSTFLSKNKKLDVKVVNKDIVLFKAFDKDKNYSESGIMNRNSGEFVHETTKDLKSDNFKKDISFYKCTLQV